MLDGFFPGKIEMHYVDLDRAVMGGAVPMTAALTLETDPELRAEYFLRAARAGRVECGRQGDGDRRRKEIRAGQAACLYVGRGSKAVSFESADAKAPAAFYLLSYLAHAEYPTTMVKFAELEARVHLGSVETCNKRSIYKAIFLDGIESCQLVMGFTMLAAGVELEHDAFAYAYAAE